MNTFEQLRQHALATDDPPHVLAQILAEMLGADLTQRLVVAGMRRAFPSIPLSVALEAQDWHRVGGTMTDSDFDKLLMGPIKADLENRFP